MQRLAAEHPDKPVVSLDPLICPCSTMFRIDAAHLAGCSSNSWRARWSTASPSTPDTAEWAKVALQRMLDIT